MEIVTIDKQGRITLPEILQKKLNLYEGQELSVQLCQGHLVLQPRHKATMHLVEGFPVFAISTSHATPDDVISAIQSIHDERAKHDERDKHNLGL